MAYHWLFIADQIYMIELILNASCNNQNLKLSPRHSPSKAGVLKQNIMKANVYSKTVVKIYNELKHDNTFYQLFKARLDILKTNISHKELCRLSEELENCNQYLFDLIFILNSEEYIEFIKMIELNE
ncbi:hypothetical protein [Elizabethkingia anophelis]|uniref:hypothetical protein n=1 Tax=Elizabethkingia anophelis TaxID=1117645 RepID=UPI00389228F1